MTAIRAGVGYEPLIETSPAFRYVLRATRNNHWMSLNMIQSQSKSVFSFFTPKQFINDLQTSSPSLVEGKYHSIPEAESVLATGELAIQYLAILDDAVRPLFFRDLQNHLGGGQFFDAHLYFAGMDLTRLWADPRRGVPYRTLTDAHDQVIAEIQGRIDRVHLKSWQIKGSAEHHIVRVRVIRPKLKVHGYEPFPMTLVETVRYEKLSKFMWKNHIDIHESLRPLSFPSKHHFAIVTTSDLGTTVRYRSVKR